MNAPALRAPASAPHKSTDSTPKLTAAQLARAVWFSPKQRRAVLDALYRRERLVVVRFAARWGVAEWEADDVCAEVFLVAYQRLSSFRAESTPRTWLLGIARRVLLDRHRRSSREQVVEVLPEQESGEDLEASLLAAEDAAEVRRAVQGLDPAKRAVVQGYHLEDASMVSLARRAGVPLQTAYARLYAGQAQLRSQLAGR